MNEQLWLNGMLAAVTVCDKHGVILEMNNRALEFNQGTRENLIGSNIVDCHPVSIKPKAKQLLNSGRIHTNLFEKDGKMYISYYTPWILEGEYNGLVEFIMEIPSHDIPKIIKQAQSLEK